MFLRDQILTNDSSYLNERTFNKYVMGFNKIRNHNIYIKKKKKYEVNDKIKAFVTIEIQFNNVLFLILKFVLRNNFNYYYSCTLDVRKICILVRFHYFLGRNYVFTHYFIVQHVKPALEIVFFFFF